MSEEEIANSTLRHVMARIKGWYELSNNADLSSWQTTRWLGCLVNNLINSKKLSVTDLIRLPGDEKINRNPKAETQKMMQLLSEWNKK